MIAMPSRTRCWRTMLRTASVTSTISLRWVVFTGSVASGCDCMIEISVEAKANRSPQPDALRADQLKFVLPGPLIENAVAKKHRLIELQPQVRQPMREGAGESPRGSRRARHDLENKVIISAARILSLDGAEQRSGKVLEKVFDDPPSVPRPRLSRRAMTDSAAGIRLGFDQRKHRGELPL